LGYEPCLKLNFVAKHKHWLSEITKCNEKIYGVNGKAICITEKGVVKLKDKETKTIIEINNVHYSPDVDVNLISLSTLQKLGVEYSTTDYGIQLSKDNKPINTGPIYKTNLYVANVDIITNKQHANYINEEQNNIWHQRLGHINHEYINNTIKYRRLRILEIN